MDSVDCIARTKEIWEQIRKGAYYAGADEAEDCAQAVICRFLASGRTLDDPTIEFPAAFWGAAGRREATREWRKRRHEVLVDEWWQADPSNVEAMAINNITLAAVPPRIVDMADRLVRGGQKDRELRLSNAERQALWKWRHKARRLQ